MFGRILYNVLKVLVEIYIYICMCSSFLCIAGIRDIVDVYACFHDFITNICQICTCHLLWFHFINILVNQFSTKVNIYLK